MQPCTPCTCPQSRFLNLKGHLRGSETTSVCLSFCPSVLVYLSISPPPPPPQPRKPTFSVNRPSHLSPLSLSASVSLCLPDSPISVRVCICICTPFGCLSVSQSVSQCVCLSVRQSVSDDSVCLSVCLSVCQSFFLSVDASSVRSRRHRLRRNTPMPHGRSPLSR